MKTKLFFCMLLACVVSACGNRYEPSNSHLNMKSDTYMLILNSSSYKATVSFDGNVVATVGANQEKKIDIPRYSYPFYIEIALYSGTKLVNGWTKDEYTFNTDYWYKMIIKDQGPSIYNYAY